MTPDEFKTFVEIANGIVTTGAILLGGGWFLFRRSLAGTLQIGLTLTDVTQVNNIPTAIIRVTVRNVGQTRIRVDYCTLATRMVYVFPSEQPIEALRAGGFDYEQEASYIFQSLAALEPSEESYEDIALALHRLSFFGVGVRFKRERSRDTWQATAMFNVEGKSTDASTGGRSGV